MGLAFAARPARDQRARESLARATRPTCARCVAGAWPSPVRSWAANAQDTALKGPLFHISLTTAHSTKFACALPRTRTTPHSPPALHRVRIIPTRCAVTTHRSQNTAHTTSHDDGRITPRVSIQFFSSATGKVKSMIAGSMNMPQIVMSSSLSILAKPSGIMLNIIQLTQPMSSMPP